MPSLNHSNGLEYTNEMTKDNMMSIHANNHPKFRNKVEEIKFCSSHLNARVELINPFWGKLELNIKQYITLLSLLFEENTKCLVRETHKSKKKTLKGDVCDTQHQRSSASG